MRLAADEERRLIQDVLEREARPFFDEYRRLMFTLLGDLGYYKRPSIDAAILRNGYLTDAVLIGFGDPDMTRIVYRRIAVAVVQALIAAVERGYTRLRVAIPCNRLSDCASYLGDLVASPDQLDQLNIDCDGAVRNWRVLGRAKITTHPLVDAVVRHVQALPPRRVLVLAAPEVLLMYEQAFTRAGLEMVEVPSNHQGLVNRLVLASIAHDQREIAGIRSELVRITDQLGGGNEVAVIEACTDFDVNVGMSSLAVYASTMVRDYYSGELGLG